MALDPATKAARREARAMTTFATKRHVEHGTRDDFCSKCRANANAIAIGFPVPYPVGAAK